MESIDKERLYKIMDNFMGELSKMNLTTSLLILSNAGELTNSHFDEWIAGVRLVDVESYNKPKEEVLECKHSYYIAEDLTRCCSYCSKSEEVAEECPRCKKHRQDAVEDAKKWVEKVNLEYNLKSEPKKIEPLERKPMESMPIVKKINEIINFINNN